jgi:LPXTG-motif cell wall-anchored protein
MGILLPILLGATLLAGVAYFLTRRRAGLAS